jgi:hypothetical protein
MPPSPSDDADAGGAAGPPEPDDLDAAIAAVYGGPPDQFVTERDALARSLRGAGRRDEAASVRKLPKPRRVAWALDAAVLADPDAFGRVDAAAEALGSAGTGSKVRDATTELRAAARALADVASTQAAAAGGAALDQSELVPAVLAVAADPEALATLRAGRLVDVPSAGAFGMFAPGPDAGPAPPRARARSARAAESSAPSAAEPSPAEPAPARSGAGRARTREVKAAERAVERAQTEAETARTRADEATATAAQAEADLETAEDRRRRAQREVEAAREHLHEARRVARRAAGEAQEADDAVEDARAALAALVTRR